MRYYYDNPLKAAWMAWTYGFRFENFSMEVQRVSGSQTININAPWVRYPNAPKPGDCYIPAKKIYIIPSCHDLLKPLGTDLIEVFWLPEGSREAHFSYMTKNEADKVNKENEQMGLPFRWLFSKIILRSNHQWFTPQQSIDSHLPTQNITDFLKV